MTYLLIRRVRRAVTIYILITLLSCHSWQLRLFTSVIFQIKQIPEAILCVKCNHRHSALMTGSARNHALVPFDFGPKQLNGDLAINRLQVLLEILNTTTNDKSDILVRYFILTSDMKTSG